MDVLILFIRIKLRLLILFFAFFFIGNTAAQHFSTIHWMQGIPQSKYTNPGLYPDARIYVGMPGVSSVNLGYAHSGFMPGDLLRQNDDGSFYIDDENMLSKLKDKNYLGIDYQHELLAFGFKSSRENYYSFNLTERANVRLGYPKDLFYLALKGNDYFVQEDRKASFSGLGANVAHYREMGVGFSRYWLDNLTAGARVKILFGMGNVNFAKTDLSLYTNPDTYDFNIHSDVLINTSLPLFEIEVDSETNEFSINEKDGFLPEDYLLNMNNLGFAIDIGGVYEITDRFLLGLSVLDLGFVSWNSDVSNLALKGDFDFTGISLDDFFDEDANAFEDILDSISGSFEFEKTSSGYRTMLPTHVLLSGTFKMSDRHKAGLMARGEFYDGSFYPSFTAAYSIQPIRAIGASLSYSIIYGNYSNIGAGLHINIWPLQIYLVTDNFFPSLQPHKFQTTTVQLGVNWVIGYSHRRDRSKPLYSW